MSQCSVNVPGCTNPAFCPVGAFFDQQTLLGTCVPCTAPAGYYCDSGVVTLCPAGFYCPTVAGSVPIECPDGYVCQAGFTEPQECTALSKCPAESSVKKPGVGAILILVAMIVLTGLIIWMVRKLRVKRLRKSTSAAQKHKEVKSAFAELMQGVTGTANSNEPLQGFNEKIRYTSPVSIAFKDLGMTL